MELTQEELDFVDLYSSCPWCLPTAQDFQQDVMVTVLIYWADQGGASPSERTDALALAMRVCAQPSDFGFGLFDPDISPYSPAVCAVMSDVMEAAVAVFRPLVTDPEGNVLTISSMQEWQDALVALLERFPAV